MPAAPESFLAATSRAVNVASVPQRSPFRYPGGKTWLVPYARLWLTATCRPVTELIEPFAGGAIIGLTAAFEGLAQKTTLVELDPDVAAVWKTILSPNAEWLANRIATFVLSENSASEALMSKPRSLREKAFLTILRNRIQRGGIMAPGAGLMRNGENGKGLASRWYPHTLRKRILDIASLEDRIRFQQGDGIRWVRRCKNRKGAMYFVDPPYTIAGRRLYRHSDIDHEELFNLMRTVQGDFLMTYDDSSEIRRLAVKFRFDCETVVMRNTHHTEMAELLVGRNLNWLRHYDFKTQASFEFAPQIARG